MNAFAAVSNAASPAEAAARAKGEINRESATHRERRGIRMLPLCAGMCRAQTDIPLPAAVGFSFCLRRIGLRQSTFPMRRIDQLLANLGYCSRREARAWVDH